MKTNLSGSGFLPLIDVLFSTMGIMILLAAVFSIVMASGDARKVERGNDGNVFWMEPVFILLNEKTHTLIADGEISHPDTENLIRRIWELAGQNDTNQQRRNPVRYAFVFGLNRDSYTLFNELENELKTMDEQMSAEGTSGGHFPLRWGKFPAMGDSLPKSWRHYVETP